MPATQTLPAPHTAWEAALRLVAERKHVHYMAEGESTCLSRHCGKKKP